MKKQLTVSLVLLLCLFAACETQVGTAIGTAFGNLFSGNGFSNSSSDELYEKMKNDQISKGTDPLINSSDSTICSEDPIGEFILGKSTKDNISKIKNQLCTCKAWGTCDKKSCQCQDLCPKDFKILDRPHDLPLDAPENSLSFTNSDKSFYEKDSNYNGYCWGHALVTQRFNRLATFSPSYKKMFNTPDESSQRIRQYKYIISKLDNNETVEIMGFKNLQEFSSDPEVKELLQENVKENWAESAMSTQGLSMVTGSDTQGAEYYTKLFDDVEFRLKNHQSPAIVINEHDNATKSHTVLVNDFGVEASGERYLCIRDNNVKPEMSLNCKNKMTLKSDGTVYYSLWKATLGKTKLSYSENSNTLEQIKSLHKKCQTTKGCLAAEVSIYDD